MNPKNQQAEKKECLCHCHFGGAYEDCDSRPVLFGGI